MQCSKVKRMAVDEYIREQQKIKKAKRTSDEFEKIKADDKLSLIHI